MAFETGITLYRRSYNEPNEASVIVAMTTLDLQFEIRVIEISEDEHMQDWYRKINPNSLDVAGGIPAITDTLPNGEKITLFETGTILEYLVDRYDFESRIKPSKCLKSEVEVMNLVLFSGLASARPSTLFRPLWPPPTAFH
ncbi:hypothetical protein E4U61_004158 [Claviceps capensis]|nr:hypothetical protein E4U61_004158 [Claviceps capensis]